ncbi:MAG: ABC transporter substrate-binding protein [Oscillospiraceae bacterium]|nr:ABC transporter substrate-binding protein [Oscillospiraceae bacterium]
MKNFVKLVALILALALLCACGAQTAAPAETTTAAATAAEATTAPETTAAETTAADDITIRAMVLSGTTGFGMAKLIADAEAGETAVPCTVSVETDASNVTAALVSGSIDVAALPTNAAAAVYNKTQGGVQVLALNTRGVLYLMTGAGESVSSFADLKGKTVYVPAQNPTFIFTYLCEQNGLTPGEDITIDNTYAQPADLQTALASGEITLAVLPEPMVTIAKSANQELTVALDLTEEWDKVAEPGSLVQGCLVARTEFVQAHPEAIAAFLQDCEASVQYLTAEPAEAAALIEQVGIFAKAAVAEKAIPNCNVCFVTGSEMKTSLGTYLGVLFGLDPSSVGGAIPDSDFYYTPQA